VIVLAEPHAYAIREHGRRAYPEECCGVLLGRNGSTAPRVEVVREFANVHEDERRRRFLIDPRDYLAAEREARERGLVVLGFYHSHPDHPPEPSTFDRVHAWPNLHYLIVGVAAGVPGEITSWLLSEDRSTMRPERIASEGSQEDAPRAVTTSTAAPTAAAVRREE
jgi:proteasome lid subunit RPN8/RPN11